MLLSALFAYYLLPHETNNHRARLLHPLFVALSLFLFLVSQVMISFLPKVTPVVLGYASNIPPEAIVELTNQKRAENGAPALNIDSTLTQAALAKGSDMLTRDYWAHVSPEGVEPWSFFVDAGYRYRFAGENLARDFTKAEDVVDAWMASPTHRENLLAGRYQDIGIAVVDGEFDGVETSLVVQLFGTKFGTETEVTETPISTVAASLITPSQPEKATQILLSPFSSTRRIALFIVSLFFTLLSIDMVIVSRKNVARRASRSFAHMLFFGMIIIALLAAQSGSIL